MTRLLLLISTILALTIVSCSDTVDLVSKLTVLDHSSCEEESTALIKLEASGGLSPYVYTLWDLSDNSMILSEKTDEGVVMVGKKDLLSINYKFILTDSDGERHEEIFQIIPEGKSVIASQLTMQKDEVLILAENIEIQLVKINSDFSETTLTDHNGFYSFKDLPAGNYTIEVLLHEKYDDYILVAKNDYSRVRVEPGTHLTRPFTFVCSENFEADLILTN